MERAAAAAEVVGTAGTSPRCGGRLKPRGLVPDARARARGGGQGAARARRER